MEIAISGEGDAPAKRCGVTMKLTEGIIEAFNDAIEIDLSDYDDAYTVVDADFEGQTVVGTPIEIEHETTYAVPIVIGVTKGLYDKYPVGDIPEPIKISGEDLSEDIEIINPILYKDENDNCALVGMVVVDDENSTQLAEDNWETLTIGEDEYPFFNDNSFGPTDLIFTPAEII